MEHIGRLFTVFVLFMLFRGILQVILGGGKTKRPRQPYPEEDPDAWQETENGCPTDNPEAEDEAVQEPNGQKEEPDFVTDFERRLKKNSDSERDTVFRESDLPVRAGDTKKKVHRDDELHHDTKGHIHKEEDKLSLEKSPVYKEAEARSETTLSMWHDPKGLNSALGRVAGADVAAISPVSDRQANQPEGMHGKLKRKELVRGFIVSQLLDEPRSLKPYGSSEGH